VARALFNFWPFWKSSAEYKQFSETELCLVYYHPSLPAPLSVGSSQPLLSPVIAEVNIQPWKSSGKKEKKEHTQASRKNRTEKLMGNKRDHHRALKPANFFYSSFLSKTHKRKVNWNSRQDIQKWSLLPFSVTYTRTEHGQH